MPEPEPEPADNVTRRASTPTLVEPRTRLETSAVPQAAAADDDTAGESVFHQPSVVDYHQRLREEVMRHVVHQQREALFLERLERLKAGAAAAAAAAGPAGAVGSGGGLGVGGSSLPQGVYGSAHIAGEAAVGGGGGGATQPTKSFTPRENATTSGTGTGTGAAGTGGDGVRQPEPPPADPTGGGSSSSSSGVAAATYAAQREAVSSAVDSLLR